MKFVPWILFLALAAVLFGVSGCEASAPDNSSVRPWNSPQGWENGVPIDTEQHP